MNTKDEKNIRGLEAEIQEIKAADRGKMATFIQRHGMQLIVQTLSIVIALTIGWVTINYNVDTIKKDHIVMAAELENLNNKGSLPVQILQEQYKTILIDIRDIKNSQLRFEDKLDALR